MSLTIASTTSSQEEMDRVVSSDDWRTPPPEKAEEPTPSNGEIPLDKLPPKEFNKIRDEQVRENKDAARDALNGEQKRYRSKGGGESKRIDHLTRQKYELLEKLSKYESLDSLDLTPTERRRLEEKGLANSNAHGGNGVTPAAQTPPRESAPATPEPKATEQNPRKIEHEKRFTEAAARYPDFKETLEAADRSGINISERLDSAIRATGNVADVAYFIAKNPKLISELEKDPSKVAQISRDLQAAPNKLAHREAARQQELLNSHAERLRKAVDSSRLQRLHNDAVATGIDVTPAVRDAVLEQTNSEQVLLHLLEHHDLRAELSKLSPAAAISRIGRLAEKLEAKAAKPKVQPPPPIEPVTNAGSRGNVDLFSKDVPMSVYIRERNKQERARGRR